MERAELYSNNTFQFNIHWFNNDRGIFSFADILFPKFLIRQIYQGCDDIRYDSWYLFNFIATRFQSCKQLLRSEDPQTTFPFKHKTISYSQSAMVSLIQCKVVVRGYYSRIPLLLYNTSLKDLISCVLQSTLEQSKY